MALGLGVLAAVIGAMTPEAVAARRPRASAIVAGGVDRTSVNLRATYDVDATVGWMARSIDARTVISVTNTSGGPIDRVELNTVAASLGNMDILRARVDGRRADVQVRGQTVRVPLGGVLPKGAKAQILLRYRASFDTATAGIRWIFAKADGILAAYRWIPWISRERPWLQSNDVGDPFFTPVSPRVEVTLTSDQPLDFVTNGRQVARQGLSRTFVAERVRDFNFTAAPDFRRRTGRSVDGQTQIVVYTRSGGSETILRWARRALDAFEDEVGRYPYPRYVISESPGPSGIESPGLTWIGHDAIGTGDLPYLVVHETAHQWFYSVVGNDQPRDPFADEAAAEFLTRWLLGSFRGSQCRTSRLDGSIYAYPGSCIYEIVYVQGASFLNGIRSDIGNGRFWTALRSYWRTHRFDLGSTFELLEVLRAAGQDAGVNLRPRYRERFPSLY